MADPRGLGQGSLERSVHFREAATVKTPHAVFGERRGSWRVMLVSRRLVLCEGKTQCTLQARPMGTQQMVRDRGGVGGSAAKKKEIQDTAVLSVCLWEQLASKGCQERSWCQGGHPEWERHWGTSSRQERGQLLNKS